MRKFVADHALPALAALTLLKQCVTWCRYWCRWSNRGLTTAPTHSKQPGAGRNRIIASPVTARVQPCHCEAFPVWDGGVGTTATRHALWSVRTAVTYDALP